MMEILDEIVAYSLRVTKDEYIEKIEKATFETATEIITLIIEGGNEEDINKAIEKFKQIETN